MAKNERTSKSVKRAAKDIDLDGLKSEIEQLRSDLGSLFEAVLNAGEDKAEDATSSMREELHERWEALRDSIEHAKERGEQAVETAQHTIEERPLISVMVAFGVGLLTGKLIGRK